MSLLAQILLVTALIAGMMLFRLLADRVVTKSRLPTGSNGPGCGKTECLNLCDHDEIAGDNESVTDKNAMKRSACRAP